VLLSDPESLTVAFKVSLKPRPAAAVLWMACVEDTSPAATFQRFSIKPLQPVVPLGFGYLGRPSYDTEWGTEGLTEWQFSRNHWKNRENNVVLTCFLVTRGILYEKTTPTSTPGEELMEPLHADQILSRHVNEAEDSEATVVQDSAMFYACDAVFATVHKLHYT